MLPTCSPPHTPSGPSPSCSSHFPCPEPSVPKLRAGPPSWQGVPHRSPQHSPVPPSPRPPGGCGHPGPPGSPPGLGDLSCLLSREVYKDQSRGFPGGTVVESLPAGAVDTGSSPGLGGSHMPQSNWAREPQLLSLRVWSLCSAAREAVTVRGPRTAMKSGPRSPQLEKALPQKRRPNTAKNK